MSAPEEMVEEFGMVDAGAGEEGLFGRKKNVGPPPFYFFFMSLLGWWDSFTVSSLLPTLSPPTLPPTLSFGAEEGRRGWRCASGWPRCDDHHRPPSWYD